MTSPGTSCRPRLWSISRARSSSVPSWRDDTTQTAMANPPSRKASLRPKMRMRGKRRGGSALLIGSWLTIDSIAKTSRSVAAQTRAGAFARLFEAVREGVFIGALAPSEVDATDSTLAANPHLKQIFGYPVDAVEAGVAPFSPARVLG